MASTGVSGLVALAVSGIIGMQYSSNELIAQCLYHTAIHTTHGKQRSSCSSSNRTIRNISGLRGHPCLLIDNFIGRTELRS